MADTELQNDIKLKPDHATEIELHASMVNIQTLVFLDLEATGLLTATHKPKVTELTMVAVHCSEFLQAHLGSSMPRIINKLTLCFNPKKGITQKAMEMTGLYNDSMETQSEFDENAATLINLFLRRLAPPVCFLAHYGNRFDYPLLKAEILNVGCELTGDIVCADTWEMFQSLDNRSYIPVSWTSKQTISHDLAIANGIVSHKNDSASPQMPQNTDNHKKRHSQSSSSSTSDGQDSSKEQSSGPSGAKGDGPKPVGSKPDVKFNAICSKSNILSSNASLSLLCGGDLKSLAARRVESADSRQAEVACTCDAPPVGGGTAPRSSSTTTNSKVESATSNNSKVDSLKAECNSKENNISSGKATIKSMNPPGSKVCDTKGNVVRKMTSFSIKDIVTGDKTESSSGESSPPAIVSSGLTYRGSSPPALIRCDDKRILSSPPEVRLVQASEAKIADGAMSVAVSNENLDSVNNNSDKSSKDNNVPNNREKNSQDNGINVSGFSVNAGSSVAFVQCASSENSVESSSGEKKVEIRKPAKKRFSRGCESHNFDNHDGNCETESVKTDVSFKSISPETVAMTSTVKLVQQVPSKLSETVIASSNPVVVHVRSQTPESHLMSESQRSCPRSPTKRKPSDSNGHENDSSKAKKVKKKLFESDSASVRELVRAASNSPGSDSGAEPVSSSQGNNGDSGNNKQRLESLGTIIYWHDYFNEEFFKESLEMEDCLHPKPDSSSSRMANSETDKQKSSDVKRPQTLSVSVSDTINSNDRAAGHSSAFNSQTQNATNPVLRSALTAPLNLSLKDRDERDVTSSLSNSGRAQSPNHDNPNPTQRLAMAAPKGQGNTNNEEKLAEVSQRSSVSYSQRELYRRVFGIFPPISHRSEDDCITLMQIVQTVAPKAAIWLDINSCPFNQVEPMYIRKGQ